MVEPTHASVNSLRRTGLSGENRTYECEKSLEKAGAELHILFKLSRILYNNSPAKLNPKIVKT